MVEIFVSVTPSTSFQTVSGVVTVYVSLSLSVEIGYTEVTPLIYLHEGSATPFEHRGRSSVSRFP